MNQFFLIRHGTNDLVAKAIAGWSPGVHLNDQGRREAERLADRLAKSGIDRICSSPLERAQETALPLARAIGLEVETVKEIGEVQFGGWTGKTLDELEADPHWQQWNTCRTNCRPPGGETLLEVQCRFITFIQQLCESVPGEKIALVSHGDPIRTVILYYLGLSLDLVHRFEISPASVTIFNLGDCTAQFQTINATVDD
ncbi:MAG: histidine phosphatase family protein [Verrucomicrobiota bacterium]